MEGNNLAQQIMAIQRDPTLTDAEKAKKRQELLSGKWALPPAQATAGVCILSTAQLLAGFAVRIAILIDLCFARGRQDNSCPSGATCHV